jgi:hypothetical protein
MGRHAISRRAQQDTGNLSPDKARTVRSFHVNSGTRLIHVTGGRPDGIRKPKRGDNSQAPQIAIKCGCRQRSLDQRGHSETVRLGISTSTACCGIVHASRIMRNRPVRPEPEHVGCAVDPARAGRLHNRDAALRAASRNIEARPRSGNSPLNLSQRRLAYLCSRFRLVIVIVPQVTAVSRRRAALTPSLRRKTDKVIMKKLSTLIGVKNLQDHERQHRILKLQFRQLV